MRRRSEAGEGATETRVSVAEAPSTARVEAVLREGARRLVDVDADRMVWAAVADRRARGAAGELLRDDGLAGAIVRLSPPASATDADVAEVEEMARASGAVAVRVAPRPAAPEVAREAVLQAAEDAPARSLREVVAKILEGARSADPGALVDLVEEALVEGERHAPRPTVPATSEPLWPVRVRLRNWYRFRGEHAFVLEPKVYGLAARSERDAERSNWLGKSSLLLAAAAFPLYGTHASRTDDGWITRGEDEGEVEVELSDGSTVTRSKKRGKATQICFRPVGVPAAHQAAAEERVAEHVGLSERDFLAVAFVRQKEVDALVRAKPAERLATFAGWLPELAVLRAAEEHVRGLLDAEARQEELARSAHVGACARRSVLLVPDVQGLPLDDAVAWFANGAAYARTVRDAARGRADRLRGDAASLAAWGGDAARARQWEENEVAMASLRARAKGVDLEALRASAEEARVSHGEADAERRRAVADRQLKQRVASGAFDGRCPVAGLACPATAEINAQGEVSRTNLRAAMEVEEAAAREATERTAAWARVGQEIREAENLLARLRDAEVVAAQLLPARERILRDGAPPPEGNLRAEGDRAWNEAIDADRKAQELDRRAADLRVAWASAEAADAERVRRGASVRRLREALAVVGRLGAQKAVAEVELARVERGANDLLRSCGVDLSVALRWGRESTTELATTCDACGSSCSGKSKNCPRCGAERGPKVDPKVDLEPSDRSGAADDLAGLAVRLAAGAWLRDRRGSAWRAVFVDEPFGALDAANRRALASRLAGLAGGGGYRQALVVAHDAASMSALPERLTVVGGADGWSRLAEGADLKETRRRMRAVPLPRAPHDPRAPSSGAGGADGERDRGEKPGAGEAGPGPVPDDPGLVGEHARHPDREGGRRGVEPLPDRADGPPAGPPRRRRRPAG
jgi:hypothetical protein